jgi:two-component system invasion response regulator UvrY
MNHFKPAVALVDDHVLLRNGLANSKDEPERIMHLLPGFNDRETAFLKLVCTEFTYKEIANQMCLSPRTIDGYRDSLFEKLKVKTRVGLVLYAIRNGVVQIS